MKIHYCLAWTLIFLELNKFCYGSFVNYFPDIIAENGRELTIFSRKYRRSKDSLFSLKKGGSTPRKYNEYEVCVKKYSPFVCTFYTMKVIVEETAKANFFALLKKGPSK